MESGLALNSGASTILKSTVPISTSAPGRQMKLRPIDIGMQRADEDADPPQRQARRHQPFAGFRHHPARTGRRPRAVDQPVGNFLQFGRVHDPCICDARFLDVKAIRRDRVRKAGPGLAHGAGKQPAYRGDVACWDRQVRFRFDLKRWTRCAASAPCWSSCFISRFTMRSRTSARSPICNFASTCSLPCPASCSVTPMANALTMAPRASASPSPGLPGSGRCMSPCWRCSSASNWPS